MRRAVTAVIELTNAWEVWDLSIDEDEAPEVITIEWMRDNPDMWEWECLEESGNEGCEFVSVEEA